MTQSPCLPELPKPTKVFGPLGYREVFFKDDMNTHYLKGYEAGSAAAAQAVPEGFVLVPREPTLGMLVAARNWSAAAFGRPVGNAGASGCYSAMIDAAPTQGAEGAAPQAEVAERDFAMLRFPEMYDGSQAVVGEASEKDERLFDMTLQCVGRAVEVTFNREQISALVERLRAFGLLTPSPTPTAPQEADALREALAAMTADRDRLDALVNSPETRDFLTGVRNEVAHQVERWGTVHDRAKEPADWFWLVGYLGGKALSAHVKGDTEKAMHHCISTSAALANWHAHIAHGSGLMQPGSSDLQDFLRETFGANFIEGQEARAALAQHQPQQGEQHE